ncbi:16S rRNA processing protein RimM [Friedmanniella endophytica]|uniref:Ribosome maturation factor RimM n=1 Tax=Microlunatus kandeliicorticis TaxID=1759536 RepID=A0A7W3IUW4_9ACTN|nr:ribosome maturation factor RimM [Microlunatus kandeliicorticis]MBA8795708.1 16S rRNA processing protein RimM [Microlunatus kandeliicorticis]
MTVGVVGRAHGVRGELAVVPRTDEPDRRFAAGAQLRAETGNRRFVVSASRWHSGRLLVAFEGVADRTAAEALRGTVLVTDVPADERPEDETEYYDRQLIGLSVRTADGVPAGTLRSVLHLPEQDLLEVDTPHGLALVPFVTALVPGVDLAAGTITLADVPGLLGDADGPAAE